MVKAGERGRVVLLVIISSGSFSSSLQFAYRPSFETNFDNFFLGLFLLLLFIVVVIMTMIVVVIASMKPKGDFTEMELLVHQWIFFSSV